MGNFFPVNADNNQRKSSLLSKDIRMRLQKGVKEGYKYDLMDLQYTQIDDAMIPEICEWLPKLEGKVKILDLGLNKITSAGASMLFDTLKSTLSSIKVVYLNHNKSIDDKCMKSLGEYIKSNKYIEAILVGNNKLSDVGIETLGPYLDGNVGLKELYINGNQEITDKSVQTLVKMIESSCIHKLSFEFTSMTHTNVFAVHLACNTIKNSADAFDFPNHDLGDKDVVKICEAITMHEIGQLNRISLQNNKITSNGASVLFDTLKERNSVVSVLNLSYNQLDDACMKQLGDYIQDNEHLETLYISNNKITDKGIETLSEYVFGNTKLSLLDVTFNHGITDASFQYLVDMIKKSYLTNLVVWNTALSEENRQKIYFTPKIPMDQRDVPIKSNTKSAAKIQSSTPT